MSNANKIARYLTAIDSTPSYAINILVVKPMTVAATFFFFHTLYCINLSTLRRRSLGRNGFFLLSFAASFLYLRAFQ